VHKSIKLTCYLHLMWRLRIYVQLYLYSSFVPPIHYAQSEDQGHLHLHQYNYFWHNLWYSESGQMTTISMQYISISKPDNYVCMNTKDVNVMDKNGMDKSSALSFVAVQAGKMCLRLSWRNKSYCCCRTSRLGVTYAKLFENICCKGWCEDTGLIFSYSKK